MKGVLLLVLVVAAAAVGCDYAVMDFVYLEPEPAHDQSSVEDIALFEGVARNAALASRLRAVEVANECLGWEGPDDSRAVVVELCRQTTEIYCRNVPCILMQSFERDLGVLPPKQYGRYRDNLVKELREVFGDRVKVNPHREDDA